MSSKTPILLVRPRLRFAIAAALLLSCVPLRAQTFSNAGAIQIPNALVTQGPGSPYPSPITVSGLNPLLTSFTVTLFNFTHAYPDDVDILLVSPGGINLLLMSDCGGLNPINGLNFTFSASALVSLDDTMQLVSGTYLPTNYDAPFDVDSFAPPAPTTGPYGSSFGAFNGTNPNGVWQLFVLDDTQGNNGVINGGWALNFAQVPEPSSIALGLSGLLAALALRRRRKRSLLPLVFLASSLGVASSAFAGASGKSPDGLWNLQADAPPARISQPTTLQVAGFQTFTGDLPAVRALLAKAPPERSSLALGVATRARPICELTIPMPRGGKFARFRVEQIEMMEAPLAAKFPGIKAYRGQGIDDPSATIAIDVTPAGFHAFILSPAGDVLIDPLYRGQTDVYASYFKADAIADPNQPWLCETRNRANSESIRGHGTRGVLRSGPTLRTYRLACAANHQYVATTGGTNASGLAEVVRIINRVNAVYESELAIRMVLVANNDLIIYPDAATDPYANTTAALNQNTPNLNSVIGAANYDIGHVFTTGSGGVAQLGCVCASNKGGGTTGLSAPMGDAFSIDYVAHEMGHQFGGNHTFNGNTSNCGGGNRSGAHAYEVGSGTTIMAYAGICGVTSNTQPHSDAYFLFESFNEIIAYTTTGTGNSCPVQTATGNTAPIVNAGLNYTIPKLTPFTLTGSATDAENDYLTYCWEERDLGAAQAGNAADNGAAPIFRSFEPSYNASRTFPKISDLLNNTVTIGEQLPNLPRAAMNFRLTARDNRAGGGGVNTADITLTVNTNGPFKVTAPDTAITVANGSPLTVTWDTASTDLPPVSAANVTILLSIDGGYTYPYTLAAATANDGSETVNLPAGVTTSTARVKVAAVGNIFFDISNANFTIN